jgi:ATP-dependent helicase/nuclease subunit A
VSDDAAVRERVVSELDATFFVEAGAGTGKTTVLTARIVNVLGAGRCTIDQLAAVTFTEAAAAELRDRVRTSLEIAALDRTRPADERARCQSAARDVDQASISTIHAFAGELLRAFPLEAGLPPGFATLDEIQQSLLFDERFKAWFWGETLREPLRTPVKRALLLGLGQDGLRAVAASLEDVHDLIGPDTAWEAPPPRSAGRAAWFAGTRLTQLQRCVPYALDGADDPLVRVVLSARSSARQLLAASTEEEALSALQGVGRLPSLLEDPERWRDALDRRNAGVVVSETLQAINDRVGATLEAHRGATLADMLNALRDFVLAGVAQRRTQGVATFHDLLTWARNLLRDNASVRHTAQARYQRVFIDEFQDTDPLQAEIAFYLAADEADARGLPADWRDLRLVPGKLFVVGDPKQSIYRFRGADIAIYDDLLARFSAHRAQLSQNFRSVSPILEWVNHHFDRHMRPREGLQPAYAPLAPHGDAALLASSAGAAPDGGVPDGGVPDGGVAGGGMTDGGVAGGGMTGSATPGGVRRVGGLIDGAAADAAEAEARTFAALARAAVEQTWPVIPRALEKDGSPRSPAPRTAAYRDICILLPARTHLRRLERALEDSGVPYHVEAGKLVLATQEVRDLLACLRAIEDPSDQVALVAALRSLAYACSDVDLLRWVEQGGQLNHEAPREGPPGPVRDALNSLAEFHRRRLLLSPPALIEAFIADRLLVAAAFGAARPREAWRRLRYVVSRARAFTSTGTGRHTLRAFLDWIESLQRADVRDPESGSTEPDEDAIHIQTVHGAKGLEYPIVLLGGLGSPSRGGSFGSVELIPDRRAGRLACRVGQTWYTPDFAEAAAREKAMAAAEAVRLLYVATTRARDHLVLSLYRGRYSESSAAATIERNLGEAPPELCPRLEVPEPRSAPGDPSDTVSTLETRPETWSEHLDAERTWEVARARLLASAESPSAVSGWWSTSAAPDVAPPNPPPEATDIRRNVAFLPKLTGCWSKNASTWCTEVVRISERCSPAHATRTSYRRSSEPSKPAPDLDSTPLISSSLQPSCIDASGRERADVGSAAVAHIRAGSRELNRRGTPREACSGVRRRAARRRAARLSGEVVRGLHLAA